MPNMTKPLQYCKVISLQVIKINEKKKITCPSTLKNSRVHSLIHLQYSYQSQVLNTDTIQLCTSQSIIKFHQFSQYGLYTCSFVPGLTYVIIVGKVKFTLKSFIHIKRNKWIIHFPFSLVTKLDKGWKRQNSEN